MKRSMVVAVVAAAILAGCGPAEDTNSADAGSTPEEADKPAPVPDGKKMCEVVPEAAIEKATGDEVTTFTDDTSLCIYSLAKLRINLDIREGAEPEGTKELQSLPDVSPGATLVADEFDEQTVIIPLTEGTITIKAQLATPDDKEVTQAQINVAKLYAQNLHG